MEDTYVYTVKKPEEIIDGLAEIRASIGEWVNYHQAKVEFERGERDFEDVPAYDPGKVDVLKRQHPTAAAYLEAERWTRDDEPIKIRLGIRACDRLLNGEDYNTVLEDMVRGLRAFYMAQGV